MIAAINAVDGSALGDNLITSHQTDYISSGIIPAEAVENDQETVIMSECSILLKLRV